MATAALGRTHGQRGEASRGHLTPRQRYDRQFAQMKTERTSFDSHWRELNDYILPRRGRFFVTDRNKGDRRTRNIIDNCGTLAADTLSSGLMSGVTNPSRPWFRLTTSDPRDAEAAPSKGWLHEVTERMSTVFLRSNWYDALPTFYLDCAVFGTAAMLIEEDDETVIRCTVCPVGSYWIANDAKGRVRVFGREFQMTVRQIVEKWGIMSSDGVRAPTGNISQAVRDQWNEGNLETWVTVCHLILPNEDYREGSLNPRARQFTSVYYEQGTNQPGGRTSESDDTVLEHSGFSEFPVVIWRWSVTGEDAWGTNCPGMTALGDIKQLQLGEKRTAQGIDKLVNPPLVGPPSFTHVAVSTIPGDITYGPENQHQTLRPIYQVNPQIQHLSIWQEAVRQRIRRAFFADLFLMLEWGAAADRRQITATEIHERREEKMLVLGPAMGRLDRDVLAPGIDRTFGIMNRRGLIPEAPPDLQGQTLRVEYLTVMAQAQKAVGIGGLRQVVAFAGEVTAAKGGADLAIWDKIDEDQIMDYLGEMSGVPPESIRTDEEVEAIREARAQRQQAAQQAAVLREAAAGVKDLAAAPTEGKNALTDTIQGLRGAA